MLAAHDGSGGLSRYRWGAALALLCAAAACTAPAVAQAAGGGPRRSVVLAFAAAGEAELASVPGMSVGIMSAAQGRYTRTQLLLDITQGARIATSSYPTSTPPPLSLTITTQGGLLSGWAAALRRAHAAPQLLEPGLLGASIPGGAAYAGVTGAPDLDSVAAGNRSGRIGVVSLGSAETLTRRIAGLTLSERLIVTDLRSGAAGLEDLRALDSARAPGELLIVVQRAPDQAGAALLWSAAAGLGAAGASELSSQSTNERGLISAVDLAPTILRYLGVAKLPDLLRGKPIETDGRLHSGSLRALMQRLRVLGGRRLKSLGFLLLTWVLLLLGCARSARARASALRVGAIAVLWAPVAVLLSAALQPSAAVEYATIAIACMALGAVTDLLIPWPRAPLAPALVAVLAITVDALAHTQLLVRSLLGPNPILGARFYGIGNELKSALAVLVLAAVAAALYPALRGRRAALSMLGAGLVLAVIEGSARIGAGVGSVILVSAGAAVAGVMLAPGALTRRRALIVLASPLLALVALALLDLATAHGSGHFTGSVLDARSAGDLRDIIVRRYKAAWGELRNHAMPVATAIVLACSLAGARAHERLLAPVDSDPGWLAALAGGLACGVVGALVEDSGPVLLVVAVFTLGCVLSYLWGRPPAQGPGAGPGPRAPSAGAGAAGPVDHDLVL